MRQKALISSFTKSVKNSGYLTKETLCGRKNKQNPHLQGLECAKISAARACPFVPKRIKTIHISTWLPKKIPLRGLVFHHTCKKKITHIKLNIEHTKIVRIDKKFCKQMLKISSNFQFWHCKRNSDTQKFLALRARKFLFYSLLTVKITINRF